MRISIIAPRPLSYPGRYGCYSSLPPPTANPPIPYPPRLANQCNSSYFPFLYSALVPLPCHLCTRTSSLHRHRKPHLQTCKSPWLCLFGLLLFLILMPRR